MTLKQIKGLMEGGNFQEAADQAQTLVTKDEKNKAARLFLVQSLLGLGKTNDAQTNLNVLYSLVNPSPGPDDPLYLQALHTQNKIAVKIMEDKNAPKKVKETGRQIQLTNTQKLIEFHSKRSQTKKMCEEMETYFLHLLEAGEYKQIEENLLFLYNHPKLSPEQQIGYASRIFAIDQFYNPFTKIETLFQKVLTFAKDKGLSYAECGDGMHLLAEKVMTHLNKQNWRKEVHAALNHANLQKNAMADFQRYLQSAIPAQEIIFAKSPQAVLTGDDNIGLVNFCQAISAKSYSLLYGSPAWDSFVNQLRSVTQLPFFQESLGNIEKNQAQILIFSILDFDKVLKSSKLQDTHDEDILFIKHFAHKPDAFENLINFSTKFAGMTPFVNLYVVWCALCLKYVPGQIKAHELQQKLNLATFLQRSIFRDKLGPKGQITDFQVIANILALRVGHFLPADKNESLVEQVDQTIEKISKFASAECIKLFETEKLETQWKVELANGKWQDSILVLEKVAESKSKENDAKLKIAWIQYSFLDRIAENAEERTIFLKSIFSQLQALAKSDEKNAQPLLMMGKLLFLHDNVAELGLTKNDPKAALSQWLLALKRDQTNADIFYSLALYYLLKENNLVKAQKCLDKALLLKPNFEEAFILNFYILQREGKSKESIELVKKMQEINKNLASTYFLQAISLLNEAEYIQAIDNLQNAARFYSIQRNKSQEERGGLASVIPETKDLKGQGIAMYDSKLGLFGVSETQLVQVWTHLTLCFSKIGKPQVALKCFVRSMQEIEKIITPQQLEKDPSIASIGEVVSEESDSIQKGRDIISKCIPKIEAWQKAGRVKTYAANDQISAQAIRSLTYINALLPKSLDAKQVPRVLEECIEVLILGCRIYPDPEFAIQIALSTLKIVSASQQAGNFSFISNILAEVIQRATGKIQGSLIMEQDRTVLPKWALDQIEILQDLVYQCDFADSSLQLKRAQFGALFAISKRLSDAQNQKQITIECFERAKSLIKQVQLDSEISSERVYGQIARSALLDASKIAHQCKLIGIEDAEIDRQKIEFVRKAIMLDPNNAELWVHLHIFSDQNTDAARKLRAQAIFKAYQLDSEHLFVQEILLKHYLSSKDTYQQAFKLIVRSIQTAQQTKRKTDPIQPIIRAVLAFFNAKVSAEKSATDLDSDFLRRNQQAQIVEAISIIKLIEREDLIQMLSELSCFLQHQSEEYVHIVKYLEAIIGDSSDQVLKTMLFMAYTGSRMRSFTDSMHLLGSEASLNNQIQQLSQIEQTSDKDLVVMVKKCQEKFMANPKQNVSQLMVLQEVCIRRGLATDSVLLDNSFKFDEILENFNQGDQRILLIQALQLLKMREADKGILSTNLLEDSSEMSENDDPSTSIDDKVLVLKASRLKPQIIDSSSTHKDLLKVHLQSISSKTPLQSVVNQVRKNLQSKVGKGLETIQNQDANKLMFAQRNLMKNPYSFEANMQFIWGLIYQSQFEKASKAIEMLKRNLARGVIIKDVQEHEESLSKLETFVSQVKNGDKIDDLGDKKLSQLVKSLNMRLISEECPKLQDQELNEKIDHVAVGLVKAMFSSLGAKSESGWIGTFIELTGLLSELLFQSRQFTVFNKLVDRMLQVAGSVSTKSASKELVGAIWAFKCLHKSSALLEMNKVASGTQESSATLKLFRNGYVPRKVTSGMLLQTRAFIAAKNMEQAANTLELVSEDSSFVIDFVRAHALYIQQAYKEYYLLAMGLVSGSKAVLEDMKDQILGPKKRQAYFTLAYSYYLKMFAECTFLAARRQGLTLAEDFEAEEDSKSFDEAYFAKKAKVSHLKGTNALKMAQQQSKELGKAFDFMIQQVDQKQ